MNFMKQRKELFCAFLVVLLIIQACGVMPASEPSQMPAASNTPSLNQIVITTATPGSVVAQNFMETDSVKDVVMTDTPTSTETLTPVPPGVFAFFFYSPLIMIYDPSVWKFDGVLQSREIAGCYIAEQGPTDFNGPHTNEIVQLGNVNYEVLSFPELSATGSINKAYIADQSLATEWGLPVFWVSAKPNEWDACKVLAEGVLGTLRLP